MSLENAQYVHQLNPANPAGSDRLQQGDDHIRMLKAALRATFPALTGPVTVDQDFLNQGIAKSLVPFGAITLYFGNEAPSGWAICNGQTIAKSDGTGNVTLPDLRGRVPVGANDARPAGTTWGQESRTVTTEAAGAHGHAGTLSSAGGHTHGGNTAGTALTVEQMPQHNHFVTKFGVANETLGAGNAVSQERTLGGDSQYVLNGTSSEPDIGKTSSAGSGQSHAHGISSDGAHTHTLTIEDAAGHGHGVTVDVTQPSLAINYIMKI